MLDLIIHKNRIAFLRPDIQLVVVSKSFVNNLIAFHFAIFFIVNCQSASGQSASGENKDHEVYNDGKYLNVTVEEDSTLTNNKYFNKADSIKGLSKVDLTKPGNAKKSIKNIDPKKISSNQKVNEKIGKADSITSRVKKISSLDDYQDDFINEGFLKDLTTGQTVYDTLGLTGYNDPMADGAVGLDKIFSEEIVGMDKFKEQLDRIPNRDQLSTNLKKPPLEVLDTIGLGKLKNNKTSKKLKGWKSKYKEHSPKVKELTFNKKTLIPLNKMFLEGIISVPTAGFDEFGVTPQAGFKINERLSGGVGLVFQYNGQNEARTPALTLGYKAFVRYQVIIDRLYAQSESVFYHPRLSNLSEGSGRKVNKDYSLLIGGGYEIELSPTKRLTFAMFYNLKKVRFVPGLNSPFVARIGLGMLK